MNESAARLLVAVCERTVCIKINGRADFTLSLDLKKLFVEMWQRGYNHFVFELRDCLTMDSTFLGVLSELGLKFSEGKKVQNGAPLELLNPNPRIAATLETLGVADLFDIKSVEEPVPGKFEPLAQKSSNTPMELTRTCLKAHQTLMGLKPENVQKFKDVTQFLAEDLKRLESEIKDPPAPASKPVSKP